MNKLVFFGSALLIGTALLSFTPACARSVSTKVDIETRNTHVVALQAPSDEWSKSENEPSFVDPKSDGYEWEDRDGWGDFCAQLTPHWRCGRGR
jgi:hypothetical protein